ncbi:MAG: ATP-binding cassette domain-containing protein, partial [Mycoplasmatales bacterium]
MNKNPILEFKNVYQKSNKKNILKDISFDVHQGEIVGLLGHNGAGKSTLLRKMSNLESLQEGSIKYLGHELDTDIKEDDILLIPDFNVLINSFSISQNIELIKCKYKDIDMEYISKHLKTLQIDMKDTISSLSKGNAELAMLVILFGLKKKVYLLDEPLGAVDIYRREFIVDLINGLQKEGTTFIITTHLLNDIQDIIKRVIYLDNHEINFDKTMDEIINGNEDLVTFLKEKFGVIRAGE